LTKQAYKDGHVHIAGGSDFSCGSCWNRVYDGLGVVRPGKAIKINWKQVERYVTHATMEKINGKNAPDVSDGEYEEIRVESLLYDTESDDETMQINKDPFSITHTSAVFEPVFNECIRLLR
jgi:hypothetical protein